MRFQHVLIVLLVSVSWGCPKRTPVERMQDQSGAPSELAAEDRYVPPYGKAEIQRALITERGVEATLERQLADQLAREADSHQVQLARADLAVRRRFIASLEACETQGRFCPPRLDDPLTGPQAAAWSTFDLDGDQPAPLDTPLRFDAETWRAMTAELYGRGCACRTIACIDAMFVTIALLEKRPMREVLVDDNASLSITRARECLYRLRGKTHTTSHAR